MVRIFTLVLFFFSLNLLMAQQPGNPIGTLRHYGTQKVEKRLKRQFLQINERKSEIERYIRDFQFKGKVGKPFTIPVVFHIVYAPGDPYPTRDEVLAQLEALNEDFETKVQVARHPADSLERFLHRIGRADIRFCLAEVDPSGEYADPIQYIPTQVEAWEDDDAIKAKVKGGTDPWDTEAYLNIWVGNLTGNLSGYAQMPGGPEQTDGIVIDQVFFGFEKRRGVKSPYDQGKSLTHLVGSYLGLYELWSESTRCGDDYVSDTPIHNAPNHRYFGYKHFSTCHDHPVEMTMNYMDNTVDEHQYMFTVGQTLRMLAVLSKKGPRGGLSGKRTRCTEVPTDLVLRSEENASQPEDISSPSLPPSLRVYPNPAGQHFNVELAHTSKGPIELLVYSPLGQVVYRAGLHADGTFHEQVIDCRRWTPGLYILQARMGDEQLLQRLIVQKP